MCQLLQSQSKPAGYNKRCVVHYFKGKYRVENNFKEKHSCLTRSSTLRCVWLLLEALLYWNSALNLCDGFPPTPHPITCPTHHLMHFAQHINPDSCKHALLFNLHFSFYRLRHLCSLVLKFCEFGFRAGTLSGMTWLFVPTVTFLPSAHNLKCKYNINSVFILVQ